MPSEDNVEIVEAVRLRKKSVDSPRYPSTIMGRSVSSARSQTVRAAAHGSCRLLPQCLSDAVGQLVKSGLAGPTVASAVPMLRG